MQACGMHAAQTLPLGTLSHSLWPGSLQCALGVRVLLQQEGLLL
jgi:hypothetical protein